MENTTQEGSLSDFAYEAIKKKLVDLTYPPDSSLTEAGLAEDLKISRMPIRLAVKRLEYEDWLVADYRKKIKVKPIKREDIIEIYQLRELLETSALQEIFKQGRAGEYSYRIEEKAVRMRANASDYYLWEKADVQMHMEIISIFNNQRINRIYMDNQDKLIRIGLFSQKTKPHIKSVNDGMQIFVESLRHGDLERAMHILKTDHLEAGKEMALEEIIKNDKFK